MIARAAMVTYFPNTTETLAELAWRYGEIGRAWRYGEIGERYLSADGHIMFADGSGLYRGITVHTPRSHRHIAETTHGRAGGTA